MMCHKRFFRRLGQRSVSIALSLLFVGACGIISTKPSRAEVLRPTAIPGVTTVSLVEAKKLFHKGVPFIDVRTERDWDAGRIPGAIHLPISEGIFSQHRLSQVVAKHEPMVIYCNSERCSTGAVAASSAASWGFRQVYYFRDGFLGWQGAGFPAE